MLLYHMTIILNCFTHSQIYMILFFPQLYLCPIFPCFSCTYSVSKALPVVGTAPTMLINFQRP